MRRSGAVGPGDWQPGEGVHLNSIQQTEKTQKKKKIMKENKRKRKAESRKRQKVERNFQVKARKVWATPSFHLASPLAADSLPDLGWESGKLSS